MSWLRATATATAAICASFAPASSRAMAPRRRSSNCWAPKSSLKSSARSATDLKAKKRAELEKQLEEQKKDAEEPEGGEKGRVSLRGILRCVFG